MLHRLQYSRGGDHCWGKVDTEKNFSPEHAEARQQRRGGRRPLTLPRTLSMDPARRPMPLEPTQAGDALMEQKSPCCSAAAKWPLPLNRCCCGGGGGCPSAGMGRPPSGGRNCGRAFTPFDHRVRFACIATNITDHAICNLWTLLMYFLLFDKPLESDQRRST
jgi:hypothetical protein